MLLFVTAANNLCAANWHKLKSGEKNKQKEMKRNNKLQVTLTKEQDEQQCLVFCLNAKLLFDTFFS